MSTAPGVRGGWTAGDLPANVELGAGSILTGDEWTRDQMFRKFKSRLDRAITIGAHCLIDGVLFNLGEAGRLIIGDHCRLEEVYLICEAEIRIGNGVVMGWRTTVVDSDFHPVAPRDRLVDVVACSPLASGPRPEIACRRVIIDDDVYVGPNATILKGVHVGAGAFIEPGAVIVKDVPPRARMLGNPAVPIGQV